MSDYLKRRERERKLEKIRGKARSSSSRRNPEAQQSFAFDTPLFDFDAPKPKAAPKPKPAPKPKAAPKPKRSKAPKQTKAQRDKALADLRAELKRSGPPGLTVREVEGYLRGGRVPRGRPGGYNPAVDETRGKLQWLRDHGYMRDSYMEVTGTNFFQTSDAGNEVIGPPSTWKSLAEPVKKKAPKKAAKKKPAKAAQGERRSLLPTGIRRYLQGAIEPKMAPLNLAEQTAVDIAQGIMGNSSGENVSRVERSLAMLQVSGDVHAFEKRGPTGRVHYRLVESSGELGQKKAAKKAAKLPSPSRYKATGAELELVQRAVRAMFLGPEGRVYPTTPLELQAAGTLLAGGFITLLGPGGKVATKPGKGAQPGKRTAVLSTEAGQALIATPANIRRLAALEASPLKGPRASSRDDWETFGQSVDKMTPAQQRSMWETTGKARGESFKKWLAGLHRPKKKAPPKPTRAKPMPVLVGKLRAGDATSLKGAAKLYAKLRDESGEGASTWPMGSVGAYRISYNGRVWLGDKMVLEAPAATARKEKAAKKKAAPAEELLTVTNTSTHLPPAAQNRSFNVRLRKRGMRWGVDDKLTWDEAEPVVEFWDATHAGQPRVGPRGQKAAEYYVGTFKDVAANASGLDLHGGSQAWKLDAEAVNAVDSWLRTKGYA